MFQTFCLGFQSGGFQLTLLRIAGEFGISAGAVGVFVAIQFSAVIVFPLALGWLSDRIGKKIVLLFFSGLCVLSCILIISLPFVYAFAAGIFLLGAGLALCESNSGAAIADAFPGKQEKYMNYVQAFFCLGATVGPLISDRMMGMGYTWRVVFVMTGAVYALAFIQYLFAKFDNPAEQTEEQTKSANGKPPYNLLLKPVFMCLIIAITVYVAVETGVAFFLDYLFTDLFNAPQLSAAAIAMFWLSMMISRFIFGIFGKNGKTVTVYAFLLITGFILVITLMQSPAAALVCCFIIGFVHGPVWPNIVGLASREYPAYTGLAAGAMSAGSGLGGAMSPVFMGLLADRFNITTSFVVFAFVSVIGFAVMVGYMRLVKRDSTQVD